VQLEILALRHQFGVRMALGAHPKQILSLVLGRGLRLATSGVVLGVTFAWFLLQALSHQVHPRDPVTYAGPRSCC